MVEATRQVKLADHAVVPKPTEFEERGLMIVRYLVDGASPEPQGTRLVYLRTLEEGDGGQRVNESLDVDERRIKHDVFRAQNPIQKESNMARYKDTGWEILDTEGLVFVAYRDRQEYETSLRKIIAGG